MSLPTLTELLDVRFPVLQGGMTWVGRHALAAAISRAGALGVIGAGGLDPEELRDEIRALRELTDASFGVNLPLVPVRPDRDASVTDLLAKVLLEEQVQVVATGGGSPRRFTPMLKEAGATVMHVSPSVGLAVKCEAAGVDIVIAESAEAGGHIRADGLSTFALVPQVVDAVDVPVVAAGGISDARGAAAAMALGAKGVQLGTRFVATTECNAHAAYKDAIVSADSEGSAVYCRGHHASRAVATPVVRKLVEMEGQGASVEELAAYRGRTRARAGCLDGDIEEGLLPAGAAVGLVRSVPSAEQVVEEIVNGYEDVLAALAGVMGASRREREADAA